MEEELGSETKESGEDASVLSLADQNLNKLQPDFYKSCPHARQLDIKNNQLTRIEHLSKLVNLKRVDAAGNKLCRFSGFACARNTLDELDISHNQIQSADGLNTLHKLVWLSLASNSIQRLPILDCLRLLVYLDLSANKLSALPNVACLPALQVLRLEKNQISSLDSAVKYFPVQLKVLHLDQNTITDLGQFSYLSCLGQLEQISITNNPCVGRDVAFDYRPYLICCCLTVKNIDGFVVSETEQLKGEWLYSQGKGRSFHAGQHEQLIEYLASKSPVSDLVPGRLSTDFEDRLQRVLEKRKQHESETGRSESAPGFTTLKQNRVTTPSKPEQRSRHPLSPRQNLQLSSDATIQSPARNRATSSPLVAKAHRSPKIAQRRPAPLTGSDKSAVADTTQSTESPSLVLSVKDGSVVSRSQWTSKRERAAVTIQAWWRSVAVRRRLRESLARVALIRSNDWLRYCITRMNNQATELQKHVQLNQSLMQLVESLTKQITEIQAQQTRHNSERSQLEQRLRGLEMAMGAFVPSPGQLSYEIRDESSAVLRWQLSAPSHTPASYRLYFEGEPCGDVSGRQLCALVTDLDSTKAHSVQVQSLSASGISSGLSEHLIIPANAFHSECSVASSDKDDDKENEE